MRTEWETEVVRRETEGGKKEEGEGGRRRERAGGGMEVQLGKIH